MRYGIIFIFFLFIVPLSGASEVPALGIPPNQRELRAGGTLAQIGNYDLVSMPFARTEEIGHFVVLRPHGTIRNLVTLYYDLNYQRITGIQIWPSFYRVLTEDPHFWQLQHPFVAYLQKVLHPRQAPPAQPQENLNSLWELFGNINVQELTEDEDAPTPAPPEILPGQTILQDTLSLGDFMATLPDKHTSLALATTGDYQLLFSRSLPQASVQLAVQVKGLQVFTSVVQIEFYQNYKVRRSISHSEQYSAAEIAAAIHDLAQDYPRLQVLGNVFAIPLQDEAAYRSYLSNLKGQTYPENLQRRLAYLWQEHPSQLITCFSNHPIGGRMQEKLRHQNIWQLLQLSPPRGPMALLKRGNAQVSFYYHRYNRNQYPRVAIRNNNSSSDYVIFLLNPDDQQTIENVFFTFRNNPDLWANFYDEFSWAQDLVQLFYQLASKEELTRVLEENGQDMRQINDLVAQLKNYYSPEELKDFLRFYAQNNCRNQLLPN
ncbi:MAG: hypothetical protein J6Y94_00380 [Bacteriovoracaceae bacterium]|nr:hypothetical protein [Bacteriovoracaceae bacterium]